MNGHRDNYSGSSLILYSFSKNHNQFFCMNDNFLIHESLTRQVTVPGISFVLHSKPLIKSESYRFLHTIYVTSAPVGMPCQA